MLAVAEWLRNRQALADPHLKFGSVLLADDAVWNLAFAEFASTVRVRAARVFRGVGVPRK